MDATRVEDHVPALQLTHDDDDERPWIDDQEPGPQGEHCEAPILLDQVPELQLEQTLDPAFDHCPMLQATHCDKLDAAEVDEKVPAGHKLHCRDEDAVTVEDQSPGLQLLHCAEDVRLESEDHVPALHAVQMEEP